jgi:hypothetical protein
VVFMRLKKEFVEWELILKLPKRGCSSAEIPRDKLLCRIFGLVWVRKVLGLSFVGENLARLGLEV